MFFFLIGQQACSINHAVLVTQTTSLHGDTICVFDWCEAAEAKCVRFLLTTLADWCIPCSQKDSPWMISYGCKMQSSVTVVLRMIVSVLHCTRGGCIILPQCGVGLLVVYGPVPKEQPRGAIASLFCPQELPWKHHLASRPEALSVFFSRHLHQPLACS